MKLLSFSVGAQPRYGAMSAHGVVDLHRVLGRRFADLKSLLADPSGLEQAHAAVDAARDFLPVGDLAFEPIIPNPDKIVCVGLNYQEHRLESGQQETQQPALFLRTPGSQVGHGQAMLRPVESAQFDFEGEIAVVIGRRGRRIREREAWSHLAGYSCYNDGSVRDWQRHTAQWTAGKNFSCTGGFGPWLVTADEIPPDTVLALRTRLNGQEMQCATTDLMIHSIPRLVAYVSTFTELLPGDVIATGTPGGVGARRYPPMFMKPGDVVEVEVDRVGTLRNVVAAG